MSVICHAITAVLLTTTVLSYQNIGEFRSLSCNRIRSALYSTPPIVSTSSSIPFDASNRVINGDSRVAATYAKAKLGKAPFELADILVTDPPYCLLHRRRTGGDLRDPKVRKKKIDESDTVTRFENLKEYKAFTKEWLKPCIEYGLKPDADIIIWTNTLGKQPIVAVCKELGYNLCGEYLWAKRTSAVTPSPNSTKNEVLLRVYESALVMRKAKEIVLGPDDVSPPWSVISGYHEEESEMSHPHPCHKPFTALEPLLRAWTKPGHLVLDVFAGSGGILQATMKLGGRRVRGIETLPEWARLANEAISGTGMKLVKQTVSEEE